MGPFFPFLFVAVVVVVVIIVHAGIVPPSSLFLSVVEDKLERLA